jgi:uncharacterized delta-60 repeat protein
VAAGRSDVGPTFHIAVVRYHPDGSLDTSFNGTGKVITDFGSGRSRGLALAIQPDGKIVVAGNSVVSPGYAGITVVRYDPDGGLDSSFGGTGKVATPVLPGGSVAHSVALQADGRIVVAGYSNNGNNNDFALVRYHSNGSLDTSFNGTGKVTTVFGNNTDIGESVTVQSNGKIVVAGYTSDGNSNFFALARYNSDGSLDQSFNGTGKIVSTIGESAYATSAVLQSNGKIVVAGNTYSAGEYKIAVARYDTGGSLDPAFNGGIVTTNVGGGSEYADSVALQSDGKIMVAGRTVWSGPYNIAVLRYEGDAMVEVGAGIAVEQPAFTGIPDGGTKDFGSVLIGSTASLTFNIKSTGSDDLTGLGLTIDGANATDFSVTASPAATVAPGGATSFTVAFAPASLGAKTATLHIANNDADENPFDIILTGSGAGPGAPLAATEEATAVSLSAATLHGTANAHGASTAVSFDYGLTTSYGTTVPGNPTPVAGGSPTPVSAALTGLAPNTTYHYRLIATNTFGTAAGNDRTFTTFGNAVPGSPDTTFGNSGAVAGGFSSVVLQNDGKIVAAGSGSIARFHQNGSPDLSFGGTGSVPSGIALSSFDRSVAVHADGKIVFVGQAGGDIAVGRLNVDGTPDTNFGGTGIVATNVTTGFYRVGMETYPELSNDSGTSVAVQADGTIIALGTAVSRANDFRPVSMAVIRYNPDGSLAGGITMRGLDCGCNEHPGIPNGYATSMALESDQKIVAAGWSVYEGMVIVRYNPDGTVNGTFGGTVNYRGFPDHDQCYGVAVNDNGTIFATGSAQISKFPLVSTEREFALVGYGSDSIRVLGPRGEVGGSLAVQPDGRILVTTSQLKRYNADGSVDTGFQPAPGGGSVTLQSDGKILVAGGSLRRYHGGSGTPPEIVVEEAGGASLQSGAASIDFGELSPGASVSRTLIIQNRGTGPLTGLSVSKDGSDAGDFIVATDGATTLLSGASTTITVAFNPSFYGPRTAVLHIFSNDGDENPFDITLTGTATASEIAIEQPPDTDLTSGSASPVNFGLVVAGSSRSLTFTVRNHGNAALIGLAVTKTLAGTPGDFAVGSLEATTLAPNAATAFTVAFSPTAAGVRTATLHVASNDADENPFVINLTGTRASASEVWRMNYFGSYSNTGPGADLNDADTDGLVNLIEFATHSDPLVWSPPPGELVKTGSTLELTYTRSKAALTDVTVRFEWTESLGGPWNMTGGGNVTVLSDDGLVQVVKSTLPAGSGKRFLRLWAKRL